MATNSAIATVQADQKIDRLSKLMMTWVRGRKDEELDELLGGLERGEIEVLFQPTKQRKHLSTARSRPIFKLDWVDEFCKTKEAKGRDKVNVKSTRGMIVKFIAASVEDPLAALESLARDQIGREAEEFCSTHSSLGHQYANERRHRLNEMLKLLEWRLTPTAVQDATAALRKTRPKLQPSTYAGYVHSLVGFIRWVEWRLIESAAQRATHFDVSAATRAVDRLRAADWSEGTCLHALKLIKGFANWASHPDRRYLDRNPLGHMHLKRPKATPQTPRRRFSEAELGLLLATTEKSSRAWRGIAGPDRTALYTAAAYTGLTLPTLRLLTVGQFDLEHNAPCVRVRAGQLGKRNTKGCETPILPKAAAKLKNYFSTKTADAKAFRCPSSNNSIGIMLSDDLKEAGVGLGSGPAKLVFQSFFETFVERGARLGVSPQTMQLWMGFTSIAPVMARYRRILPGRAEDLYLKPEQNPMRHWEQALPAASSKGKRGKQLAAGEAERRHGLLERYDDATAQGIKQKGFCEDEGISLGDLEKAIDWRAKRRARGEDA